MWIALSQQQNLCRRVVVRNSCCSSDCRQPRVLLFFVQGVWSVLLCLSGTYGDLLDYVIFAVLIFFTLTILAIFVLRVKRPDIPRPYKAFGYPVIPSIYILTTVTIMVILLIYKPNYTFPGLGIVLLGIPVFYLWRKYNK